MSLKEWLPITGRNRVALSLAGLSLMMFLVWNLMPISAAEGEASTGTNASAFWPFVFSPDMYLSTIRSPDIGGFISVGAYIAMMFSGLVILTALPFWSLLHASPYLRLPIAWLNLFGGVGWSWMAIVVALNDPLPDGRAAFFLMSVSMFSISASFFLFQNELALRKARDHTMSIRIGRT